MRLVYIWVICLLISFNSGQIFAQEIPVAANKIIYDLYFKWDRNINCSDISDFSQMNTHRGEVELALLCKALQLGGISPEIQLQQVPNYSRALVEAKSGNVLMPAETVWRNEINEALFFVSNPIFDAGTVELGIYALANNTEIMQVKTSAELKEFVCASSENWYEDWAVLQQIGITAYSVATQNLMFKMVSKGRADFVLSEFSSEENFAIEIEGITLIPVPNIKINMDNSRHFVISKKAADAEKIYQALQKGLKQLRADGTINSAFYQSGFMSPKVKDWQVIN
ncbi:ABC transporter substrate-binding protein [Shewanella sp. UCD-KL21]|uniref:ABC transporter substrate-binding protein n=1 Tax=Shewanella sp. UCD-KL21 TaxID=1917164 RepID=UPI00097035D6|nr:ABC transporter substrate-binding protein [Shewanella sp. UCD-KL21]